MNIDETLRLLEALKASGVTHFKSGEHEIKLGSIGSNAAVDTSVSHHHSVSGGPDAGNVRPSSPAMNHDAARRAQELIDTLKMKDEELVNKIFPAGS